MSRSYSAIMWPDPRRRHDVLANGPMGQYRRGAFYRSSLNCATQVDLTGRKTSCATFVRAVHHWCGRAGGSVTPQGHNRPRSGDVFHVKTPGTDNDHVGIFLYETDTDVWETAEG